MSTDAKFWIAYLVLAVLGCGAVFAIWRKTSAESNKPVIEAASKMEQTWPEVACPSNEWTYNDHWRTTYYVVELIDTQTMRRVWVISKSNSTDFQTLLMPYAGVEKP